MISQVREVYLIGDAIPGVATVTYLNGAPVAGASVTVTESPSQSNRVNSQVSGTSGADGKFAFDVSGGLTAYIPGSHTVSAFASRFTNTATGTTTYTIGPL